MEINRPNNPWLLLCRWIVTFITIFFIFFFIFSFSVQFLVLISTFGPLIRFFMIVF
ncbi:hypothetical protein HanIR_Chr05g0221071 [Helianthus annuus]|nr:hypothetical protein HanIR_Chr05g0221071 [Helianthus annuus]